MAKIILSLNDKPQGEFELAKERMTIGRKNENDIPVDNLAISGIHAVILTTLDGSFVEDLGSTNGTYVNGRLVKKQILKNEDIISVGKHDLKFVDDQKIKTEEKIVATTNNSSINTSSPPASANEIKATSAASNPSAMAMPKGVLHLLNGPKAGTELNLTKALITLGKPGVQVAVISKRPQGYFVSYIEGKKDGEAFYPIVNGASIGPKAHAIEDNDILELAGIKMQFILEP
ncbi:MAG: FHA domain-containing protein [Gammaproteobacteria bacterium]